MSKFKKPFFPILLLCFLSFFNASAMSSQENYDFSIGFIYKPDNPEAQLTREIMESIFLIYRIHVNKQRIVRKKSNYTDIGVYISNDVVIDNGFLDKKQLKKNGIEFDDSAKYFSISGNCRLYAFETERQDQTKYLSIINIENDGDIEFESTCAAAVISAIYGLNFESIAGNSMPEIIRNRLAQE